MTALLAMPHHDGSELYAPEWPEELGNETTVLLRMPRGRAVDSVAVRYVRDGEPGVAPARIDRETEADVWWRASFPVWNPVTPYRWLLSGGDFGYAWLNGVGLQRFDGPDADDFIATPEPGGPAWHLESVVYQVFPDRFASAGLTVTPPDWAVPRGWDAPPTGRGPETPFEWFGGDLVGLEQRLGHIAALGASVLYLTPIFPAGSTHRYDASTFERVDPLLGGDDALESLVRAAHGRGMRVLGDLTTNHVGTGHEWFAAARNGAGVPEREFFFFDDRLEAGYESWWGVPSLPKLDYRSPELRRRVYGGATSVVERWLRPPFSLDGWRIDVANMTGRLNGVDVSGEVARGVRAAGVAARGDALVVAEHSHDARGDLRAGGWHGTMNYPGFTRPVWAWLRGDELSGEPASGFLGLPVGVPRLPGGSVVETMKRFRAGVPWQSVLHSWTLLDSHDTARFRTIAGSRERQILGIGLQMTTPGVPMVFAGDEIGLEGEWGEDARRTMPWSRPETWDSELYEAYQRLISVRRGSRALAVGGIRYAHVSADAIAYLREVSAETVLCLACRAGSEPLRLPLAALGGHELETLFGADAEIDGDDAVLPAEGPAFHIWRVREEGR
ncbi:MAG: glycoside hydrolase family 13 protein [Gaiellaceae bacterium]